MMSSTRCPPGACCLDYEHFKRERGFILDCVAVSSNSLTYETVRPKLCDVIPPYNAQNDPYAKHIFQTKSMKKLLKRTNQVETLHQDRERRGKVLISVLMQGPDPKRRQLLPPWMLFNPRSSSSGLFIASDLESRYRFKDHGGTSNSGWLVDYFYKNGPAQKYLTRRNVYGAGHSHDQIIGHSGYLSDVKPIVGYNGKFGYRRNIPSLREKPSIFGEVCYRSLY